MKKTVFINFIVLIISGITLFITTLIITQDFKKIPHEGNQKQEASFNQLILVNSEQKIPENYDGKIIDYNGHQISQYIEKDLIEMIEQAKLEEVDLKINNAYRSIVEQQNIWDSSIAELQNKGYTLKQAKEETKKKINMPYYSEHATGLAIDFSTKGYNKNLKMWEWLKKNAYQYGFILRYPSDKIEITKISYEPWHYRYVGKKAAKTMYQQNICLEEYIKKITLTAC